MTILEKNLAAIAEKNKALYARLHAIEANDDYRENVIAKTGQTIPVFKNGHALHSKYNPEKEAESLFSQRDEFVLFCGIGAAIHVEFFLQAFPEKICAITDISFEALKSLLQLVDLTSVIGSPRVIILPPVLSAEFSDCFLASYFPARHGSLRVVVLRTWEQFYAAFLVQVNEVFSASVKKAQIDFATQAHFGKVWLKNIVRNLYAAATISKVQSPLQLVSQEITQNKIALICGAGPSLTDSIPEIRRYRERFAIFASDTAFAALMKSGIEADFFLSVDPQLVSLQHFAGEAKNTVGIFDLCASDALVRRFLQNGNRVVFTASNHPLTQYARRFGAFPFANSSSGTVAIYALDVAHRLGFCHFETAGLDFCYAGGKAYANGTYFEKQTATSCTKLFSHETFFSALMFRSAVIKSEAGDKLNYETEILRHYKLEAEQYHFDGGLWANSDFASFRYTEFIQNLIDDLRDNKPDAETALLPFAAFCKKNQSDYSNEVAVKTILRYSLV